jgi:uncharacterized protein (TIGR02594 family)
MTIVALVAGAPVGVGSNNRVAIKEIQLALRGAGHELLVDGGYGGITEAAVKDFQRRHGLEVDGKVGPLTAAVLDTSFARAVENPVSRLHETPEPSVYGVAPWLSVMRAIDGTKEVAGGKDSPVILSWVKEIVAAYPDLKGTVGWYNHDSIPWCGLVVGYVVVKAGFRPPKLLLGAANWFNDWPDGYRIDEPCPGAILVKTRQGGGHVTIYECEDKNFYYCRGGNQSDMVNVAAIKKNSTVRGFMWPKGGPIPGKRLFGTIASARAGSEA